MCQFCHVPPVAGGLSAARPSIRRLDAGTVTMVVDRDGGAADPAVVADLAQTAAPGRVYWTRLHRLDRSAADTIRVLEALDPAAGNVVVVEDPFGPVVPPIVVDALASYARRSGGHGGAAVLVPHARPGRGGRCGDAVVDVDGSPRAPRRRTLRRMISWLDAPARHAVAVAYEAGYWHPGEAPTPAAGVLLVALADGGFVPRSGWERAVADALGRVPPAAVASSADPVPVDAVPVDPVAADPVAADRGHDAPDDAGNVPLTLDVRLFGHFEVRGHDGEPLDLQGQRGPALFRYLLAQPGRRVPRDVLLEQFWPDVDPGQARNRLQVALSCLRRSLRPVVDAPIVAHRGGHYFVTSAVSITTDVDAFDRARADARRADEQRDTAAAIAGYRRAAELYRGPYLADSPYDEWTTLPREAYRIAHLDVLDRLAALLEHADRPAECVNVGLQMLDVDACHEEAHRLLMRSYLRLGRGHQALRQFELCRRVLRATLEMSPSSHTLGVYREVRAAMVETA